MGKQLQNEAEAKEKKRSYNQTYYQMNKGKRLVSHNQSEEQVKAYRRAYYQRYKEQISAKRQVYYQTHKAEIAAVNKVWREANKESLRQNSRAYHQSHKELDNQHSKEYYQTHREELLAKAALRYALHPEQPKERGKNYYQTHQEERKTYQRERYQKNPEYSQEYHRTHHTLPEQRGTKPRLVPNPNSPSQIAKKLGISRQRVEQLLYPEKEKARRRLLRAVKKGEVIKPSVCAKCGTPGRIHGHHSDYSKPLDVIWLCIQCHRDAHPHPH